MLQKNQISKNDNVFVRRSKGNSFTGKIIKVDYPNFIVKKNNSEEIKININENIGLLLTQNII